MIRSRRDVLRTGVAFLATSVAGCSGSSPESDVETIDSLPTPVLGPDDAPVTVAAYEDYACPHCQRYAQNTFPLLRSEYVSEGIVRYEHHDFPIPVDERWSWQTASAARAVQDAVGDEPFFEYATGLYEHLGAYSLDIVESLAADVGTDAAKVRKAAADEVYRPVLEADKQGGIERGVTGTPTVFVDGSKTSGYDWNTVSAAIEDARQ